MIVFPKEFEWGTATSSYQIEGAVKADGRGESIWDQFSRIPGKVHNGNTGEIACDHYHLFKEDVTLMETLNIGTYRFSVSWPRIFPDGGGVPNHKGLDFYKRLIDTLLNHNISPMLTLYHWDLPQALQDKGGWTNRDTTEHFLNYAEFLFCELGDVVAKWVTHNEPWVVSYLGYASGEHAPGYNDIPSFIKASHHVLLSHGKALNAFREHRFKESEIGIALNLNPCYPAVDDDSALAAARKWDGFQNRWFLEPLFNGVYPEDTLDLYSRFVDFHFIRDDDLRIINGSIDFLGINYYSSQYLIQSRQPAPDNFLKVETVDKGYKQTSMGWEIDPNGLYDLLVRIKNDYGNPTVYITENGAAYDDRVENGEVNDDERIDYVKEHLIACYNAIQNGVNLKGYYLWSFLDNFEWAFGYAKRFGIVHVDFRTLDRIPKKSAKWYSEVIKHNGFD